MEEQKSLERRKNKKTFLDHIKENELKLIKNHTTAVHGKTHLKKALPPGTNKKHQGEEDMNIY